MLIGEHSPDDVYFMLTAIQLSPLWGLPDHIPQSYTDMLVRSLTEKALVSSEDWGAVLHECAIRLKHSKLTKIFSSPDVHLSIIFSQVVKPGLVNHKDASSYDRSSARENRNLEKNNHTYM